MKLDVRDRMGHPRQVCWAAYRDELPSLAEHLPNVTSIEVLSRESPEAGVVEVVSRWRAEGEIPLVARRLIRPEIVAWTERAVWDERSWICSWELEPAFFTRYVKVSGSNQYRQAPQDRCEIHITGELSVDVRGMRGVPRLLVGQINAAVESFVVALVRPNLRRLNRSVDRVLDLRAEPPGATGGGAG